MKIISNITFHAIPWVIEDIPAFCKVSIAVLSMYLMVCWSFQLLVTVYFIVVLTTSTFLTSQSVLSSSVSINMVERVWWCFVVMKTSYILPTKTILNCYLSSAAFLLLPRQTREGFLHPREPGLAGGQLVSLCMSCLSLFSTRGLPSVLQHSSIKQSKFQK